MYEFVLLLVKSRYQRALCEDHHNTIEHLKYTVFTSKG